MLSFSFTPISQPQADKSQDYTEAWMPYVMVTVSVILVTAALLAAQALGYSFSVGPALLLPVLIGTLRGGFGGGLFAMVLGVAVDSLLFQELMLPERPFSQAALQSPMGSFLGAGVMLSFIGQWFRQFGQKNRDAAEKQQALEQEIGRRRKLEEALLRGRRTAQAQLTELEEIYAVAPIALCRVNRELRCIRVNRAWLDIGGLAPEAHLGHALQDVMPELGELLALSVHKVLMSGEPVLEREVCAVDRVWLASFMPMEASDGGVAGVNIALRDITARKRCEAALRESEEKNRLLKERIRSTEQARQDAEAESRRLVGLVADLAEKARAGEDSRYAEGVCRAIGESLDYGVWLATPDGRFTFASDAFLALTGLDQARCAGLGWLDVLHPEERDRVAAGWEQAVRAGTPWASEHRCRGVDGRWHPILARGVPIRDANGAVTGWAGIHLDIGRLNAAEAALRETDRKRDEFLGILAHELRNPLAPILTSAQLLRCRGLERPDLLESATGSIERQVKHLSQLISEFADMSRISRGKIELKPEILELDAVVAQAVEACRPLIAKHRQELAVDLPPAPLYVQADPTRLAQVVNSVLNNAAKFTPAEGKIQVGVRSDGHDAFVSVRDTGIGIDPVELERIFEPFVQLERPLHGGGHNGLGIGLALAKGLVEMHGGTISAHSAGEGQGSEFTVRLPLPGA